MARDAGVIMLSFPPHTTHTLQPHVVSVFKPLQTYYDQEIEKWLRAHPGRRITTFHINQLLAASYVKAATMVNAINGFRKAGIRPCDRQVFDQEFEADTPPQSTVGLQIQDESQLLDGPNSPVGPEYPFSSESPVGPELRKNWVNNCVSFTYYKKIDIHFVLSNVRVPLTVVMPGTATRARKV